MREWEGARAGNLFATPLLSHMWADSTELNPQLRESILEYERRHPGLTRTNVGGWHSEPGMLEFCGDAERHDRGGDTPPLRRIFPAASTHKLGSQCLGQRQPARRF
jgi:hypothetical protein